MAILPCLLALQAVGQSARAATVPVVTGVSPDTGSAIGSTPVTITGSGFTGATEVDFGPVPVFGSIPATSFTVVSDTKITAIAPAVALTQTFPSGVPHNMLDITVTTPNGTSADAVGAQFDYLQTPAITGVSPASGPTVGGNTVTITGTGFEFSRILEVRGLAFGSTPATSFTVNSATQITATAPGRGGHRRHHHDCPRQRRCPNFGG